MRQKLQYPQAKVLQRSLIETEKVLYKHFILKFSAEEEKRAYCLYWREERKYSGGEISEREEEYYSSLIVVEREIM